MEIPHENPRRKSNVLEALLATDLYLLPSLTPDFSHTNHSLEKLKWLFLMNILNDF